MPPALALQAASDEGAVIGHLTQVEGNVLRYVTVEDDGVRLVTDSPVGIEDLLFCEEGSKAEIIIPNNTWIRTGSTTKLAIIHLADDTTELEIESGRARLYNKSSIAVIKVATPFGSVMAPPNFVAQVQMPYLMAISAPRIRISGSPPPSRPGVCLPMYQYSSAHMDSPP